MNVDTPNADSEPVRTIRRIANDKPTYPEPARRANPHVPPRSPDPPRAMS